MPHARRFFAPLALAASLIAGYASAQTTQHYQVKDLVSNSSDSNLINPWGISRSSGGPWWISDNGTGLSTLYTGTGSAIPLVVTVPTGNPSMSKTGSPTGTIFNGGTGFQIAPNAAAIFLFATEDGTISGWNPGVNKTSAVIVNNTNSASVYKGMASATVTNGYGGAAALYLFVADFRKGHIQVFDSSFQHVPGMEERFDDDRLPSGYAPFNVQNIGGNLYVTYGLQDDAKHDEIDGPGLGYVDVYSPEGWLLKRFQHGQWMNAPWGLAEAPGDFGAFSHDILVGQFGSGEILAFNAVTGKFDGTLADSTGNPITISGLWGLSFGNDAVAGNATALYFTAGTNGGSGGLFGDITAIDNIQGSGR